VTRTK